MKILNFGSCNIDYVYSLDHIVEAGETETTGKMKIFPGGKGLNQSIAVAKAGVKVYHAGCLGIDGEMLEKVFCKNGVDISYIKRVNEKNGHAIIQVSSEGENSIFLFPGSNEMITTDYIDIVLSDFNKGDIILLQNEISNVAYIVDKAYERQMYIILNPSPMNEKIKEINLEKVSCLILNEIEMKAISGCDTYIGGMAYIKSRYPRLTVVLTLGSRGSIYKDDKKELHQAAFKVNVVDTTAAGDTFTGFFVAGMYKKIPVKETLRIASAASAIAVSYEGASSSIPDINKVMSEIDKMVENKADNKDKILLDKIESYINSNLKTANLEDLARELGYSAVYTGELIKKLKGKPFKKTVQEKKCKLAEEMLLYTDLPISEIISTIGYENESFFRRIFKEKYNNTPLEFRKSGGKSYDR